jgi:CheY-like chemotaxis protein
MPILTGPLACSQILKHYQARNAKAKEMLEAGASAANGVSFLQPPIIIALTASCMEADKQHAVETGHSDFIAKVSGAHTNGTRRNSALGAKRGGTATRARKLSCAFVVFFCAASFSPTASFEVVALGAVHAEAARRGTCNSYGSSLVIRYGCCSTIVLYSSLSSSSVSHYRCSSLCEECFLIALECTFVGHCFCQK